MKKILLIITVILLSACSFKSSQYNYVKALVKNVQQQPIVKETVVWRASIGNRQFEMRATQFDQGIRFISQQGLEVDFDTNLFSVIVARGWEYSDQNVGIHFHQLETADPLQFEKRHRTNRGDEYRVICDNYQELATGEYARQCTEYQWQWWRYEDKLFLDENKHIYRIEAGILLGTEPLIIEWQRGESSLKNP